MDCRLHFKDVFFVSPPRYLQDKNTWPFSEEMRAIDGGQRQGRRGGGGLCVNQIQWIIFFNVFTERVENQRISASKRERKKKTKPTKAVKTFGLSVGAENAKQIGGIFPTMHLKCAAVLGSPSPFAQCGVFGWCISSSELRAASQGLCVLCSDHQLLSVLLHNHRALLQRCIGPLDLFFQQNQQGPCLCFFWCFLQLQFPHGVIYSFSRICQNRRLRILNIIVMH